MNRLLNIALIAMMSMLLHGASMMAQTIVKVKTPGTMATSLTSAQRDTCTWLVVKGKLNTSDVLTLRRMAGADGGNGVLKCLDLRDARFTQDNRPFLVLNVNDCQIGVRLTSHFVLPVYHSRNLLDVSKDPLNLEKWKTHSVLNVNVNEYKIERIRLWQEKSNDNPDTPSRGFRCVVEGVASDFNLLLKTGVARGNGYAFVRENGQDLYKAYLQKKNISDALFYGTKTLNTVIIPRNLHYDPLVRVNDSEVRFFRPK